MVLHFFLLAHLLLNLDNDMRVQGIVLEASLFDALYQGVVDQLFNRVFPFTALWEQFTHHLFIRTVGEQTQHF